MSSVLKTLVHPGAALASARRASARTKSKVSNNAVLAFAANIRQLAPEGGQHARFRAELLGDHEKRLLRN